MFGLPLDGEREFLRELCLELRDAFTIGGEESLKRCVTKTDGMQVGAQAFAAAMARMAAADQAAPGGMSAERMREQQRLSSYQMAEAIVP